MPPVDDESYHKALEDLRKIWAQLEGCFQLEKKRITEILEHGSVFKIVVRKKLPEIIRTMRGKFPSVPYAPWLHLAQLLQRDYLTDQLMARHKDTPLDAQFFDLCVDWNASLTNFGHQHLFHCIHRVRESFSETKTSENLLTFDDMLPAILDTLEAESGNRLHARLQRTYQAALIDEFQDTDPQQTELFKRLFISPDHFLYLIGDPKQAIYKFRGADIFSYLQARLLARRFYTCPRIGDRILP